MKSVVIDTNCIIQILGIKSPYRNIWKAFMNEEYTLCVSTEIIFEYEEILRTLASPIVADMFLKVIDQATNVIHKDPYFRLGIITHDNDDNKFVDCAFACQADYIVTDDKHFGEAANSQFPQFKIISLDDFYDLIVESD